MISFEDFWKLHAPKPEYQPMRDYCRKIWDSLPPDKQDTIYRNIEYKKQNQLFVDYNPYYAIQKNGNPMRRKKQVLSMSAYYAQYGTTAETDGWRMENPTGNKVIYVK